MQLTAYLDDHVFTLSDALTSEECARLIDRSERIGYAAAPITTAFGFVHDTAIRSNTRVMFDDEQLAAWLWERVRAHVPAEREGWEAVGLNERLRFYRYEEGQAFRWHHDGYFQRHERERSFLTCIVYLNDDFAGGETEFEPVPGERFGVRPREGSVLLFDHPVRHQGAEVLAGRKYALRTDVMYRLPASCDADPS